MKKFETSDSKEGTGENPEDAEKSK